MKTALITPEYGPVLWKRLIGALLALMLFAPVSAMSQSPARVNIGTAGDFIALAKTGISATGTTQIVGDIGVSPTAATSISGFGLIMHPSGTYSTSTLVAGKVYAANYASPTPSKMTTAIGDLQTAYTDAAGRTTPNFTELYAGDVTGRTLTPGLYKWSTGLLVSAGGVTISGGPSDVWIFQVAGNLTIANSAVITLRDGAQASNIFWQVAGQVTIGTYSAMKGIILCQTAIIMSSGAAFDGRALAQSAVTLDGNAVGITITSDTTRPFVIATDPVNGDSSVALNKKLTAIFNEPMDPLTINALTFTVQKGAIPVPGTVTYVGKTATFTPTNPLDTYSLYNITITTGVKDTAGNTMAGEYQWRFNTGGELDTAAPYVLMTDPANGDNGVATNTKIAAIFSEAMDPATINTSTFMLEQGTTIVPGRVTYFGTKASFAPSLPLAGNTNYFVSVTTGAKDLAGNAMVSTYTWTFTTGNAPDSTAPNVSSTDPANLATGVGINKRIAATFNEVMDPTTINSTTFLLMHGATPVYGNVTYAGLTATFAPHAPMLINTLYTATITTGVEDLAGNTMLSTYTWSFTTGEAPDYTRPTVTSTDPFNGAIGVAFNKKVSATFSEAMDPTSINVTTFTMAQGTTPVAGKVTYAVRTAVFSPTVALLPNTIYTMTITIGAKDLAGNPILYPYTWSFTTGSTPDTKRPIVIATDPVNGATNVSFNKKITAIFSERMDPSTISTSTFQLHMGSIPVAGTVTYAGTTTTFAPASLLSPNTMYTATITNGAMDLAGNALLNNYTWTFTTGLAPDTTRPFVVSTNPAHNAAGVATNVKVSATFNELMDPLTINTATFMLFLGPTQVYGTVVYAGKSATFTPLMPLTANATYTAIISSSVEDLAGKTMLADYTWSFKIGTVVDKTAPTVVSTDPENAATDVFLGKVITATFSEVMDPMTIHIGSYILYRGTTQVPGTVSYSGLTAVFVPYNALQANTVYTATITNDVEDYAGNAMINNHTWSFTTGDRHDNTAPYVFSTDPTNAETGVPINKLITVTFSEAMNPLTINDSTFSLKQIATPVLGTVSYSGTTATFTPTGYLAPNTIFTATITTGVEDLSSNSMTNTYTWTFTTGSIADTTRPLVCGTDPMNGAIGVSVAKHITTMFCEPMNPSTINSSTYIIMQGSAPIAGTVTYSGMAATFVPMKALEIATTYSVTITTGVRDLAGNSMSSTYTWSFTTSPTTDAETLADIREGFVLFQNYPNPFNPTTSIQYNLETAGHVSLKVYNVFGNEVATLVNGPQEAGSHTVQFGSDDAALRLSSGVYSYQLQSGSFFATRKMLLSK